MVQCVCGVCDGRLLPDRVYVYARYKEPNGMYDMPGKQVILVIINNSTKDETIRWDRYQEIIKGKEIGVDVLSKQTVNFDLKTAIIPAKTAYILELK